MTTLYHPTLDAQVEVEEANVSDWTDQGWRKTPPSDTSAAATASDKTGDDEKGKN